MFNTVEFQGKKIYQGFNYPKDISGLDRDIIDNTLDYLAFVAEMSDSYVQTKSELSKLSKYKKEVLGE